MLKKILLTLLVIFILIQFIRPQKNNGVDSADDITHAVGVSAEVKNILATSCYDCHSNHTDYPWFTNIQPVAYWINTHITDGKDELNFSEFNTYKLKRKIHKFKEIAEQVKENEMPIFSYSLIHSVAKLSEEQKNILIQWAEENKMILQDTSAVVSASL